VGDKATGAKKCLKCPKRYVSQQFLIRIFNCEAGTFHNPLQICDSCNQSSEAQLLPN